MAGTVSADSNAADRLFEQPQPKAFGEKDVFELIRDLQTRVARLESQAGTS